MPPTVWSLLEFKIFKDYPSSTKFAKTHWNLLGQALSAKIGRLDELVLPARQDSGFVGFVGLNLRLPAQGSILILQKLKAKLEQDS